MKRYPDVLNIRENELIMTAAEAAADIAAAKVFAESGGPDYYRTVERLLYNYKRLEALTRNAEEYLTVELHSKSKSITVYSPSGGTYRTEDEALEEIAHERLLNYERTAANFRALAEVIDLFRDRKEFIVIRMYYLGEDAEGRERPDDAEQYTWQDIALELSARGVLKDEKTARRWRTNIVTDIAVCMFGRAAAISASAHR
jgi:hypothetical protein